jgi:hypothetical protein
MSILKRFTFKSISGDKYCITAANYDFAMQRFNRENPFNKNEIKTIEVVELAQDLKLVVIDSSSLECVIYDFKDEQTDEYIEKYIESFGHKLSQVSWGLVDHINDKSNS